MLDPDPTFTEPVIYGIMTHKSNLYFDSLVSEGGGDCVGSNSIYVKYNRVVPVESSLIDIAIGIRALEGSIINFVNGDNEIFVAADVNNSGNSYSALAIGVDISSKSSLIFVGGENSVKVEFNGRAIDDSSYISVEGIRAVSESIIDFWGGLNTITVSADVDGPETTSTVRRIRLSESSLNFEYGINTVMVGFNDFGYIKKTTGRNDVAGIEAIEESEVNFFEGINTVRVNLRTSDCSYAYGIMLNSESEVNFSGGINFIRSEAYGYTYRQNIGSGISYGIMVDDNSLVSFVGGTVNIDVKGIGELDESISLGVASGLGADGSRVYFGSKANVEMDIEADAAGVAEAYGLALSNGAVAYFDAGLDSTQHMMAPVRISLNANSQDIVGLVANDDGSDFYMQDVEDGGYDVVTQNNVKTFLASGYVDLVPVGDYGKNGDKVEKWIDSKIVWSERW